MNQVILCGRLTADPVIRESQGGVAVGRYTLAVDRRDKDKNTDFINCVVFGKTAEFAEKYLQKGTKILVTGGWQAGSYTDKDGHKVYTNECIVREQEFCESKGTSEPKQTKDVSEFVNVPDDVDDLGLPFN